MQSIDTGLSSLYSSYPLLRWMACRLLAAVMTGLAGWSVSYLFRRYSNSLDEKKPTQEAESKAEENAVDKTEEKKPRRHRHRKSKKIRKKIPTNKEELDNSSL